MTEREHATAVLRELAAAYEAGRLAARFDYRRLTPQPPRQEGESLRTKRDGEQWHH